MTCPQTTQKANATATDSKMKQPVVDATKFDAESSASENALKTALNMSLGSLTVLGSLAKIAKPLLPSINKIKEKKGK